MIKYSPWNIPKGAHLASAASAFAPPILGWKNSVWGSLGGLVVQYTQNAPPHPVLTYHFLVPIGALEIYLNRNMYIRDKSIQTLQKLWSLISQSSVGIFENILLLLNIGSSKKWRGKNSPHDDMPQNCTTKKNIFCWKYLTFSRSSLAFFAPIAKAFKIVHWTVDRANNEIVTFHEKSVIFPRKKENHGRVYYCWKLQMRHYRQFLLSTYLSQSELIRTEWGK